VPKAWTALKHLGPSSAKQLHNIAAELEEAVASDIAGTPAQTILDSWEAWWEDHKGKLQQLAQDRVICECSRPVSRSSVRLFSSGQVETVGPCVGGSGIAQFSKLDDFEKYLKAAKDLWLGPQFESVGTVEFRTLIANWIQNEAIPKLRHAEKQARKV
jgi:hypothetical protein